MMRSKCWGVMLCKFFLERRREREVIHAGLEIVAWCILCVFVWAFNNSSNEFILDFWFVIFVQ